MFVWTISLLNVPLPLLVFYYSILTSHLPIVEALDRSLSGQAPKHIRTFHLGIVVQAQQLQYKRNIWYDGIKWNSWKAFMIGHSTIQVRLIIWRKSGKLDHLVTYLFLLFPTRRPFLVVQMFEHSDKILSLNQECKSDQLVIILNIGNWCEHGVWHSIWWWQSNSNFRPEAEFKQSSIERWIRCRLGM